MKESWFSRISSKLRVILKRSNTAIADKEEQRHKHLELSQEGILPTKLIDRHRKRAIFRARKYKSDLVATNQKIVIISLLIIILVLASFSGLIYWRLYQVQDHSAFMHNITRFIPLPVAKVGSRFVTYEAYLKELRRQIYYFETHFQLDFSQTDSGSSIVTLAELKNDAMQRVVTKAYIANLADRYNLEVSDEEIAAQLGELKRQNNLGGGNDDLETILDDFWGLTIEDYRQAVADHLLRRKVIRHMDEVLDNNAYSRMTDIEAKLKVGGSFSDLANQFSEDIVTARNGGIYNFTFSSDTQQEHPLVVEAVFNTEIGQISDIIDTGRRLEIIKVLSDEGDGLRRAAHITIYYLSLGEILDDIYQNQPVTIYIDDVIYSPEISD